MGGRLMPAMMTSSLALDWLAATFRDGCHGIAPYLPTGPGAGAALGAHQARAHQSLGGYGCARKPQGDQGLTEDARRVSQHVSKCIKMSIFVEKRGEKRLKKALEEAVGSQHHAHACAGGPAGSGYTCSEDELPAGHGQRGPLDPLKAL